MAGVSVTGYSVCALRHTCKFNAASFQEKYSCSGATALHSCLGQLRSASYPPQGDLSPPTR